jgi:hypothetical protein
MNTQHPNSNLADNTNLCMAVGIMSLSCSLLHMELPSASVRKLLSFASFRRRSFSNSRAICCRAQNVAAARWKFSPAGPSNWKIRNYWYRALYSKWFVKELINFRLSSRKTCYRESTKVYYPLSYRNRYLNFDARFGGGGGGGGGGEEEEDEEEKKKRLCSMFKNVQTHQMDLYRCFLTHIPICKHTFLKGYVLGQTPKMSLLTSSYVCETHFK